MESETDSGFSSFEDSGSSFPALVHSLCHLCGGKSNGHPHFQQRQTPGDINNGEDMTLREDQHGGHNGQGWRVGDFLPKQQRVPLGSHGQVHQAILGKVLTPT